MDSQRMMQLVQVEDRSAPVRPCALVLSKPYPQDPCTQLEHKLVHGTERGLDALT